MSKQVILKIGAGDFNRGFPVTLDIKSDGTWIAEREGQLPPAPMIPGQYSEWRARYSGRGGHRVLEAVEGQVKNISVVELAAELQNRLNQWLLGREFIPIKEGLLDNLNITDNILFIIKAQDQLLQRLPWHLCDLFERYHNAEVVISNPYQPVPNPSKRLKERVRILVILGVNSDINVQADLDILKDKLPDAEIVPLIATTRDHLNNQLWEQEWDMLFFAGHSCSDFTNGQGRFYINEHESIAIEDLKYGLRDAIKKGLKLAIFNSCDGLGLAKGLADLQMPAIVVMRERVPDEAAQKFLEYFLQAFAEKGMSLHASVREARDRLHGLEDKYPCASWLPVLCQHPNAEPLTWMGLREIEEPDIKEDPPVFNQFVSHIIKHKVAVGILTVVGLIFSFSLDPMTTFVNERKARDLNKDAVEALLDNQPGSARSQLEEARKLNPENGIYLYNLGRTCEDTGDYECAVASYEAAMKYPNVEAVAYNARARFYIKENNPDVAANLLGKAKDIVERDQENQYSQQDKYAIYKNLAWARLKQTRYPEAIALLKAAIELEPKRAPAYCLYAELLEAQGNEDEALNQWKSCNRYADGSDPDEDRWIGEAQERLAGERRNKYE